MQTAAHGAQARSTVEEPAARRGEGGEPSGEGGRKRAASDALAVFLSSRLAIFVFGVFAFLTFQPNRAPDTLKFDLMRLSHPFGGLIDVIVPVWARWDSIWFLQIASDGYSAGGMEAAFFPLYPLFASALGFVFAGFGYSAAALFVGALAVSLLCFGGSLYVLHRLVALELGERFSRPTLMLLAFSPMAVFFSGIYSESLFLLVSVAAIYFGRRGRWFWAGLAGGMAAATRSAGLIVIVPLLILYLWGPREDRPPIPRHDETSFLRRLKPRYGLDWSFLWLALVPAGVAVYAGYLWIEVKDPLLFVEAQGFWLRKSVGPFLGIYDAGSAAFQGARQLLSGSREPIFWTASQADPFRSAAFNIELFVVMVLSLVALVGTFRRLPFAYGAYATVALLLPLSTPAETIPLLSFPRFVLVIFPLFMWLATWTERRGHTMTVVAIFACALGLFVSQWATWQWVS